MQSEEIGKLTIADAARSGIRNMISLKTNIPTNRVNDATGLISHNTDKFVLVCWPSLTKINQFLSFGNELLLAAVQRLWDICYETQTVSGLDEDSVYSCCWVSCNERPSESIEKLITSTVQQTYDKIHCCVFCKKEIQCKIWDVSQNLCIATQCRRTVATEISSVHSVNTNCCSLSPLWS